MSKKNTSEDNGGDFEWKAQIVLHGEKLAWSINWGVINNLGTKWFIFFFFQCLSCFFSFSLIFFLRQVLQKDKYYLQARGPASQRLRWFRVCDFISLCFSLFIKPSTEVPYLFFPLFHSFIFFLFNFLHCSYNSS